MTRSRRSGGVLGLALVAALLFLLLHVFTGPRGGGGGPFAGARFEREGNRVAADFAQRREIQSELRKDTASASRRRVLEGELRRTELRIDAACEDVISFAEASLASKDPLAMGEALRRLTPFRGGAAGDPWRTRIESAAASLEAALRR